MPRPPERLPARRGGIGAAAIRHHPGPGPCDTDKAGVCPGLVQAAAKAGVPLLGTCLGRQAIGQAFGGRIVRAGDIVHGRSDTVHHEGPGAFRGLPSPFRAARCHSPVVGRASLPRCLDPTAAQADGTVAGLRHRSLPIEGMQFHPESVRSGHGRAMMRNFLDSVPEPA